MNKADLRSEILRSLNALTSDEVQGFSFSLTNQLIKLIGWMPELTSQIGAGYLPFGNEIAPVYQVLFRSEPLNMAYPILKNGMMSFAIPDGMPRGGIWLDQPYHEVKPDWMLIPGLGFGLKGQRLGRGKGFYDRYLEDSEALRIGLAWSGQIKDEIPVESFDCHMDFIITENFCWDVDRQEKF